MNGTVKSGKELVNSLKDSKLDPNAEVVVAPPALHLLLIKDLLQSSKIEVSGQNAYFKLLVPSREKSLSANCRTLVFHGSSLDTRNVVQSSRRTIRRLQRRPKQLSNTTSR